VDSVSEVRPAGLKLSRNGNTHRIRVWHKLTGLCPPTKLGVFNNTLDNGYRAFAERYFLCKTSDGFRPALPVHVFEYTHDHVMMGFLESVCAELDLVPVASNREVVGAYTGAKRMVYEQASEEFYRDGVTRRHAMLHSFVKFEKQDLSKAPRVINPRSTVYNLRLGRFLKFNEKKYYKALATVFGQEHVVIKGLDTMSVATQLRQLWDDNANPIAIGGDASKFDMHVSKAALYYEHLFYIRPYYDSLGEARLAYDRVISDNRENPKGYSDREELCWLLSQQLYNRGRAWFDDGKLSFEMEGTRASGDLNTSLGNCLLMCALTHAWARRAGTRVALANNGDDCQYFMDRSVETQFREGMCDWFATKGFRMVLEDTAHEFESVEFCQAQPVLTFNGWNMVRNPQTLITKATMCLTPVANFNGLRRWMMAVGVCEGSLARGVPVVQAFAACLRANGSKCTARQIELAYHGSTRAFHADMNASCEPITDVARNSFHTAFGVTPEEQMVLESHYSSWRLGPWGETMRGEDALAKDPEPLAPVTMLLAPAL